MEKIEGLEIEAFLICDHIDKRYSLARVGPIRRLIGPLKKHVIIL